VIKETEGKGPVQYSSKLKDDGREQGKVRVASEDD
jgi:hypothetical protein